MHGSTTTKHTQLNINHANRVMTCDGCMIDYMNFTYSFTLLVHIYCMILLKLKT